MGAGFPKVRKGNKWEKLTEAGRLKRFSSRPCSCASATRPTLGVMSQQGGGENGRLKDPRKVDDSVPTQVRLPPVILPKSGEQFEKSQKTTRWRKTPWFLFPISGSRCSWEDAQLS